jgi:hypothetical protein
VRPLPPGWSPAVACTREGAASPALAVAFPHLRSWALEGGGETHLAVLPPELVVAPDPAAASALSRAGLRALPTYRRGSAVADLRALVLDFKGVALDPGGVPGADGWVEDCVLRAWPAFVVALGSRVSLLRSLPLAEVHTEEWQAPWRGGPRPSLGGASLPGVPRGTGISAEVRHLAWEERRAATRWSRDLSEPPVVRLAGAGPSEIWGLLAALRALGGAG